MVEFKDLKQDGSYEVLEKVDLPHDVKCGSQIVQYNFCGECGELLKPQSPKCYLINSKE